MSTSQLEKFQDEVVIPEGVTVTHKKHMLTFVGPLGKTHKSFRKIPVNLKIEDNKILLSTIEHKKRDYAILHAARSVIRNICEGLIDGYTIKMKVVFAHFPITVKVEGKDIIIEKHISAQYLVYFLGFSPGFPYIGGMDKSLETPRLKSPRTKVPAGSVAIGGKQTGIYPMQSPGGWNIVGNTPVQNFN